MTQFVEANNAVFRYEHVGNAEGAGTPLLLVHELGGDMTSWDPALAAGLCANRPAMRFDWRGAGMSEKIRGHFDIDVMCADIAGIVKETGFGAGKPVDVVGIALGGGVVIGLAARYPEMVRRLVSTSSAIGGSVEAGARSKHGRKALNGTVCAHIARPATPYLSRTICALMPRSTNGIARNGSPRTHQLCWP